MKKKSKNFNEILKFYPQCKVDYRHGGIDLSGKKINHLLPIYFSHYNNRGGWVCKCDCGQYTFYNTDKLTSGEATTCSSSCVYKKTKVINLTNQVFGRLTVISSAGPSKDGHMLWRCRCSCGNETYVEGRYLTRGRTCSCGSCPDLLKSAGNNYINNWLLNKNINFKSEVRFDDCKNKVTLPFDFVLYDQNNNIICCIEYQGVQHYTPTGGWFTADVVKQQQKRDQIKSQYCKHNNIPLYIINYQDFQKLDDILQKILEENNYEDKNNFKY